MIDTWHELDTQLEPGQLGDRHLPVKGALSDDVHVHVTKTCVLGEESKRLS